MKRIRSGYQRLDQFQRRLWVKVTLTVVLIGVCAAVFIPILIQSYDFRDRLLPLMEEMYTTTINDPTPAAFFQTGEYVFQDETYGGVELIEFAKTQFSPDGRFVDPGSLAGFLLARSIPDWMPGWLLLHTGTTWLLMGCLLCWLVLVVWLELSLPLLVVVLVTGAAVLLASWGGLDALVVALIGIGLLTFTFALLMRLALLVWSGRGPLAAVASGVLREASRTRLSLVFIVILLILLPLLPMALDAERPLRYQIQTFISHSMQLTFAIAACLTLILGCATVSFEIRDRQIWQVVSKPIARGRYLVGKWFGIITVNLILVSVAMVAIFMFIQYLRTQPVADGLQGDLDRMSITQEILTARVATLPDYPKLTEEEVEARLSAVILGDPAFGDRDDMTPQELRKMRYDIADAYYLGLRSIGPGMARQYKFVGLQNATLAPTVTLKFRFLINANDDHETYRAAFRFQNDDRTTQTVTYIPSQTHVLQVPSEYIDDDGELVVDLLNLNTPLPGVRGTGAINFEGDGFELLYKVGNFEPNFARAVLQTWIKLCFLAALGVSCATFLNFPVACLTSFTIFLGAVMTPYLAGSLWTYAPSALTPLDTSSFGSIVQWTFDRSIEGIAHVIVFGLSWFGDYQPRAALVEGRYITWWSILTAFFRIGVIWSGLSLLVGYIVLRQRQLAVYSGSS